MMMHSKENESSKQLAADLANSLKSTTALMGSLLGEIRDNATSLAVLKTKIESIGVSVERLSSIVRDDTGAGSMITRMALIEHAAEDVERDLESLRVFMVESVDDLKQDIKDDRKVEEEEEKSDKEFNKNKWLERAKFATAFTPGLVALVILLIKMYG